MLLTVFSPLAVATLAPPHGDTFINSGAKNTNYGANNLLKISPTQSTLIQFDLSTLPAGTVAADIDKAT